MGIYNAHHRPLIPNRLLMSHAAGMIAAKLSSALMRDA